MAEYFDAPEVEEVARKLIADHHGHLVEARIRYLFREGAWSSKKKETWGNAQVVTGAQKHITGLDFIITINKEVWEHIEPHQRMALVDHELTHCECGEPDAKGNPTWFIQGHDVEDFARIVKRHGLWNEDITKFFMATKQLTLFNQAERVVDAVLNSDLGAVFPDKDVTVEGNVITVSDRRTGTEG